MVLLIESKLIAGMVLSDAVLTHKATENGSIGI